MGGPDDMGDPVRRGGSRRTKRCPDATTAEEGSDPPGMASPQPSGTERRPARKAAAETAFDIWLRRSLHQMFDRYKDEDIPAEWLRMIQDDRDRRRGD